MASVFVVVDGVQRPVRSFTSRPAALAFAHAEEIAARAYTNPFPRHSSPWDHVKMSKAKYLGRLSAVGLTVPSDERNWPKWWNDTYPDLTAEQVAAVWELHAPDPAGSVIEIPLED